VAKHAFAPEDKQARRQVILTAACRLFVSGDGRLPSAAQIAIEANLAKGNVYLYFRTKEEIFANLLFHECHLGLNEIEGLFRHAKGKQEAKIKRFISTYVDSLFKHPELLWLERICQGVVQQNLLPDKLRELQNQFSARQSEVAAVLERALKLNKGKGNKLLTRTFALTRGLWQIGVTSKLTAVLQPPDKAFKVELTEALSEYWKGAAG
jgi:AcrR family transcriptional regulator